MSVFKKRKAVFCGTPSYEMPPRSPPHSSDAEAQAEAPVERLETASSKKLAVSPSCPSPQTPAPAVPFRVLRSQASASTSLAGEPSSSVGEMKGYRLIDCAELLKGVSGIGLCDACGTRLTVRDNLVARRGLVSKLMICCPNTAYNKESSISDPYSETAKSLNARSVLAMRTIGRGHNSLESFCGVMDMLPPLTLRAFSAHNRVHAAKVVRSGSAFSRKELESLVESLVGHLNHAAKVVRCGLAAC